jgi:ABC-type branched-subunit amino acid transport system substrate-binding protein
VGGSRTFIRSIAVGALALGSVVIPAAGAGAAKPTGTPIKLSVMATATGITGAPQVFDGAAAAADAINAAGGIPDAAGGKSHPLELVECRGEGSASTSVPQVALKCATDAEAEGVVADTGKYLFAQLAIEEFQKNSVPLIGTFLVDATDITNPNVFALGGGAVMEVPGTALAIEKTGAKTLGYVSADNPAGRALVNFIKPVLSDSTVTIEEYLPLDPSADISSSVSKLVQENPDGVVLAQTASVSVKLTQALRAAGYQGKIGFSGANLNKDTIEQLGKFTTDLVSASNYPATTQVSNKQIKQFNADMNKYSKGALKDEFSLNAWYAVQIAAGILNTMTEYTPAAMLAATKGYRVDTGLVPPFTLGTPDNYLDLPNVPRGTVYPLTIKNGDVAAAGRVLDLNAAATAAAGAAK